jgi:Cu/Ag efflux pump CusA
MVLLFLRDWRSSLVVVLNIPLAILASVTAVCTENPIPVYRAIESAKLAR